MGAPAASAPPPPSCDQTLSHWATLDPGLTRPDDQGAFRFLDSTRGALHFGRQTAYQDPDFNMATNVNAAALDESPIPDSVTQQQHKQTVDPYNVRLATVPCSDCAHAYGGLTIFLVQ